MDFLKEKSIKIKSEIQLLGHIEGKYFIPSDEVTEYNLEEIEYIYKQLVRENE